MSILCKLIGHKYIARLEYFNHTIIEYKYSGKKFIGIEYTANGKKQSEFKTIYRCRRCGKYKEVTYDVRS